jgi:ankyrin repeat protein
MVDGGGWAGFGWYGWNNVDQVREWLEQGANPNADMGWLWTPLHQAAASGSAEVVAELAGRAADVDAMSHGCTALWRAVAANRPDNARALLAAGADPLGDMMSGWSPARLSLAGLTDDVVPH